MAFRITGLDPALFKGLHLLTEAELAEIEPDDLLRYGLIPELVGRLPVVVPLEALDEEALVRILKEPKNALTKQYQKLFELETVRISFEESALRAVAQKALKRGTGARGLRAIQAPASRWRRTPLRRILRRRCRSAFRRSQLRQMRSGQIAVVPMRFVRLRG